MDEDRIEQGSARWLAERRSGIGGSEISALYRLPDGRCAHPWMSQVELWASKTGRLPDEQPTPWEAPHLYVGRVLERPVREMYETFSGRTVDDGVTLLRDAESGVLLASTDGQQTCPSRCSEPGVYEGKVTTVFRRADWLAREELDNGEVSHREIVPLHYRCQTQHYMACTGLTWASVVAFMQADRSPIHWRDVERHDDFIADMRERAARWWRDHVVTDRQPEVDNSAATEHALRKIHSETEETILQFPAAFAGVLDRLDAIDELGFMLKAERQRLRNMVLAAMGSAALAVIADDGRGWALRGERGRSLRALTREGIARARKRISADSRPVFLGRSLGAELDKLYSLNLRALTPGTCLSAKAMHLAHLAATAAHNTATE